MLREARPSAFRSGLKLGVALLLVIAGFPLARNVAALADRIGNPFGSQREERVDPAVLTALSDLDELHAATAELQVVVEIEDDTRLLPDFVSGRQTTLLAAGSVDGVVDLGGADLTEAKDGSIVVTLPAATLGDVVVDHARSEVLDRDRGAIDRLADAVGDPVDDQALFVLAADELARSASESDLLAQAEANARATVEQLLADAGVEQVTVVFTPAPGDAA